jgi:hypothetical protein
LFRGNPRAHGHTLPGGGCRVVHRPLTLPDLEAHLAGLLDVGVIPLCPGGVCWWGGIDLDADKLHGIDVTAAAGRLQAILGAWGLRAWVFTSRARGYHVLVFFDAPVAAWALRGLLALALREARLPSTTERFPKQDTLSATEKGVGNWLRLPYFGKAAPGRRCAIDGLNRPMSLEMFLASVERTPAERVQALAELHGLTPEAERQRELRLTPRCPDKLPVLPDNPRDLGLSDRLALMVKDGWREGYDYPTRSELQMAVFTELANLGWGADTLWAVVLNPAWKLDQRTSRTGKARKDFGRSIGRALAYAESSRLGGWAGGILAEEKKRLRGAPLAQCVLADIREHVNRRTSFAVVTQEGIHQRLGVGLDAVKKAVRLLKARGLLEVLDLEDKWITGHHRRGYRPLLTATPAKVPPRHLEPIAPVVPGVGVEG